MALLLALAGAADTARAAASLDCSTIPRLMRTYLQNHVLFHRLDDQLKGRVAESHLRSIDPSRSLLLEKDAEQLRKGFDGVFVAVDDGNCGLLESTHQLTVQRYRTMEEYVRSYVGRDDYEIDRSAELIVDPEERGFPTTREEQEDLYRRLVHFQMSNYISNGEELGEAKKKLIHRYELMTKRAEEMDQADIYARFLEAFASSLDPHSSYLSADNLEDFKIHMALSLEGIGAVLSSRDGYTVIEEIVPGGAADEDGRLKAKDKILAVGQADGDLVDVIDMDLRDVVRLIRGEKGSTVQLSVLRQSPKTERFTASLVRDKIDLEQQAAKLRFEPVESGGKTYKLAVIELPSFYGDRDPASRQATTDVARLIQQAKGANADGLLLDLSRNGGGLLEHAVRITGYFLGSGGVVAVGDEKHSAQVLEDPDPDLQWDGPLAVLTSRVTASAGEILAGAIKDYDRGIIVGDDHTFGKGSVQTVAPLEEGLGALKLTTALFYRPGGESTQRTGVPADIVLPSLTGTEDFGEVEQPYALPPRSIEDFGKRARTKALGKALGVDDDTIALLNRRSAERVARDEKFAEVQKLLEEARASDGVVRVSELLEGADETQTTASTGATGGGAESGEMAMVAPPDAASEASPDEDELSPQAVEALRILADLVATRKVALSQ